MELDVYIVLIVILASADWRIAVSEDCVLAGKSNNQNHPVEINARRQGTNIEQEHGRDLWRDLERLQQQQASQAYPTVYFPRGSTPVTATLLPLHFLYVDPRSIYDHCDLWIRMCMRAYDTGYICANALHGTQYTFSSYCAMEYANCYLKSYIWRLMYFGNCKTAILPDGGEDFNIEGDNFLEAAIVNQPPTNPFTGEVETYV